MYEHVPTFVCAYVYMHGAQGALCVVGAQQRRS